MENLSWVLHSESSTALNHFNKSSAGLFRQQREMGILLIMSHYNPLTLDNRILTFLTMVYVSTDCRAGSFLSLWNLQHPWKSTFNFMTHLTLCPIFTDSCASLFLNCLCLYFSLGCEVKITFSERVAWEHLRLVCTLFFFLTLDSFFSGQSGGFSTPAEVTN